MMALFTKPVFATVKTTPHENNEQKLPEVEVAFSEARLAFDDAYQRFFNYHKAHKSGPHFALVGNRVNVEFPHETGEARALAVAATKAREAFHILMRERAELCFKLGLSK